MGQVRCCRIIFSLFFLLLVVYLTSAHSCGERKVVNQLIVNGIEAKDGYWPWHAALFHKNGLSFTYECGGTILDTNTVLTAAHCVMKTHGRIARRHLTVQVGRHQISAANNRVQVYIPSDLFVHPKYSLDGVEHDIALVMLETDITYTDYIQPICLWNRADAMHLLVGSWGTVVGFGIDENDVATDTLREATIQVVSHMTCIESNRPFFGSKLTSNMFCAGNRDGVSACNGDSGGGLYFKYNNVWFIRGIVSFGKPREYGNMNGKNCDTKEYTVFTDVAKYLPWIEHYRAGTDGQSAVTRTENSRQHHMQETGDQPIVTGIESNHKFRLLPLSTCGPNPYASREELSKPASFGYPWMGLVECTALDEKETMCHATLISDFYLITSEYCGWRSKLCSQSSVRLGEYNTNTTTECAQTNGEMVCPPPVQTVRIESVIMHKESNHDIALIRLQHRADTSHSNVKPICLPVTNSQRSTNATHYILTLWKKHTSSDKPVFERSLRAKIDLAKCRKLYTNFIPNITTLQTCTNFNLEACNNAVRSAPLQLVQQVRGGSRYFLHGIHSLDWYCHYGLPTLFTNVASYIDWIVENMKE